MWFSAIGNEIEFVLRKCLLIGCCFVWAFAKSLKVGKFSSLEKNNKSFFEKLNIYAIPAKTAIYFLLVLKPEK